MTVIEELCGACGSLVKFIIRKDAVLLRDAVCERCGCSLRTSDLLKEIYKAYDIHNAEECKTKMEKYRILNTASEGYVHTVLKDCAEYICSEYYDHYKTGERNPKTGVISVDLCDMPFEDESMDLIISEDVLEHVFNFEKACREVHRCLRKNGRHMFTIPVSESIKTRTRIGNQNKVFHGDPIRSEGALVNTEFGLDFVNILNGYGYMVNFVYCHKFYEAGETTVLDESYEEYKRNVTSMDKYFKYNSIVFECKKI